MQYSWSSPNRSLVPAGEQPNEVRPGYDADDLVVIVGDDQPLDPVPVHQVDGCLQGVVFLDGDGLAGHQGVHRGAVGLGRTTATDDGGEHVLDARAFIDIERGEEIGLAQDADEFPVGVDHRQALVTDIGDRHHSAGRLSQIRW